MRLSNPHARLPVPGLRRVTFVRMSLEPSGPAQAVGLGHRHPTTVTISRDRARELAAQGIPLVRRGDPTGTTHDGRGQATAR